MIDLELLLMNAYKQQAQQPLQMLLKDLVDHRVRSLHIQGYHYELEECSFEWLESKSAAQRLFGAEELSHCWFLVQPKKRLKADLKAVYEAAKQALRDPDSLD